MELYQKRIGPVGTCDLGPARAEAVLDPCLFSRWGWAWPAEDIGPVHAGGRAEVNVDVPLTGKAVIGTIIRPDLCICAGWRPSCTRIANANLQTPGSATLSP